VGGPIYATSAPGQSGRSYRLCPCAALSFFFQAEDGIRDRNVTGVQTCALPIFDQIRAHSWLDFRATRSVIPQSLSSAFELIENRSEERRVGKECRCRWSTWQ